MFIINDEVFFANIRMADKMPLSLFGVAITANYFVPISFLYEAILVLAISDISLSVSLVPILVYYLMSILLYVYTRLMDIRWCAFVYQFN